MTYVGVLNCPVLKSNTYVPVYSCTMANEVAILGAVSLVLTILNIVCIFILGIIVLRVSANEFFNLCTVKPHFLSGPHVSRIFTYWTHVWEPIHISY